MFNKRSFLLIAVVALFLIGFFVFPDRVMAATCTWNGTTGNWSDTSKWTGCGGGAPGASDTAVINSGTVTLTGSVTVANLTLTAGTLTGDQDINITGTFSWTGGSLTGTGATNLAATGTLATSGGNALTLDARTFNNSGTVNWNSTGYIYLSTNAIFNNLSGAAFNAQTTGTYLLYAPAGSFNNQSGATFTKSSSGDTTVYNLTSFNNAGTLTLTGSGSLFLNLSGAGVSTHTGAFHVNNASAILAFQGGIHNMNTGANFSGTGKVNFAGGTENIHSIYNMSGGTQVTGGAVNFSSDSTLTSLGPLSITAGKIDLSTGKDYTFSTLNETNGTLAGSDSITVTTTLNWSGGSMSGTGATNLAATGTMATSGTSVLTLDTRTFNNFGTVNWNSTGYIYLTNNAIFNNMSGAAFNAQTTGTYLFYAPAGGVSNQSGATFTKSSSGDTTLYNLSSFNNAGTLTLTGTGNLFLNLSGSGTSTHTGAFHVNNANATLAFQGGIHNLNTGANISGTGKVSFAGGTENIDSTYNVSGATQVSAGIVNFDSDATMGTLNETSGTLTGSGTITVTSTLNWTGGSMSGFGATNLAASGTMATTGGSVLTLDTRTFNNFGTVNWNSTGYIYLTNNATFNNMSGAAFNAQTTGTYLFYAPTGSFSNQSGATLTKSSSGDTTVYNLSSFNNAGTLTLTGTGNLFLNLSGSGTSTHTGAFHVNNANATLAFQGGTHNLNTGANISGIGNVNFAGGTENIHSVYNMSGGTQVSGGTVNFSSDATLTNPGTLSITGGTLNLSTGKSYSFSTLSETSGTLTGSDTITVTTALNWTGGSMSGFGVTNLAAGGTLANNGTSYITLDTRTFNNAGTVNWNSTGYVYLINNATFKNLSGATFNTLNSGSYLFYPSGNLFNAGTMNLPSNSRIYVNQFTQTASGVLNMPIAGAVGGTGFCQFTTTTSLLNGAINLTLTGGYFPAFGESFSLLTYTTRTGTFSKYSLPLLDTGLVWGKIYSTNNLEMDILDGVYTPFISKP